MCEQKFELEQLRPGKKVLWFAPPGKGASKMIPPNFSTVWEAAGITVGRIVRGMKNEHQTATEILNEASRLHAGDRFVLDDLQQVKQETPSAAAEFQMSFVRSLFRLTSVLGIHCLIVVRHPPDSTDHEQLKSEADLVITGDD